MTLIRYLLTGLLLFMGGLQLLSWALQSVYIFMLIHSFALPVTFMVVGGLILLWFPWRGLAIMLLYNKASGRWRVPVMGALALVLGTLIYLRAQEAEAPALPRTPTEQSALRIASLNALHPNENLAPKLAFIRDINPDVMSLVEARPSWEAELGSLSAMYPYRVVTPVASNYGDYSMILLSKHPFTRVLVQDEGRIVHYNIQAPTGMFRLIQVHPYSPVTPTRHLGRNKALASLAEVEITLPVVITGDFNTVPWQRNIRQLMERFDLKMAGLPKPTFPAYQMVLGGQRWYLPPLLPLDYVLVPNAARVLASEARYVPATDHFGVVADIILPPLH